MNDTVGRLDRIQFFVADEAHVQTVLTSEPDCDWRLFSTGVQVWVSQTYVQLKKKGLPVSLCSTVPQSGVIVTHADDLDLLLSAQPMFSKVLPISVRADKFHRAYGSFEIVQNRHSSDGDLRIFIPHWPQPDLIPRNPQRGDAVRTVAFKGSVSELAEGLQGPRWRACLEGQGLEWHCDAAEWRGNTATYHEVAWNDYSAVDLVVAVRRNSRDGHPHKPASKLINAWAAGVPAILGPEVAYRELRSSDLDYIEASTPEEISQAINRLRESPDLYRAMVENGLERSKEFTAERCALCWQAVLFEKVPRRCAVVVPRLRQTALVRLKFILISLILSLRKYH